MGVSATRPREDGTETSLSSRSSQHSRFSPEMLAILEPSFSAIDAAAILERPDDYLAKLRRAARDFKFELAEADREAIKAIRRDKSLPPSTREDLAKAVRDSARTAQHTEWRTYRLEALRWVRVVRAYEREKQWLAERDPLVRKAVLIKLETAVQRAFRNPVFSLNKEEAQWRARNRKEFRLHAKQGRRQFGYRGRSDGRTAWITPLADGTYDASEVARAEFTALTTEQTRGEVNHGISITTPEIEPKVAVKDMTDDERDDARLEALLRDEVKKFHRMRK